MTKTDNTSLVGPPLEGHLNRRWHPETFWCSLKGHAAPAATAREIADTDALIALRISDTSHVARCLRCDAWIIADPAIASVDHVPTLNKSDIPQRGKDLRDAIILKLIAIDRGLHSLVFVLAFVGLLLVETHLGGLQNTARHLMSNAQNTLASTGQDASRDFVTRQLDHFVSLKKSGVELILGTLALYAIIEGVEAVGLWKQKRWAEYLTALATAGFLPLEIHELIKRVTVVRVGALVLNIVVLIYLVYAKRLFGIRGGALRDEELLDMAEIMKPLPGQPV